MPIKPGSTAAMRLTERATALYLEGDGSLIAGDDNDGTVDAGFILGWRYEASTNRGALDQSVADLRIFARSDFDLEARIIGIRATYTPTKLDWRLGGQKREDENVSSKNLLYWTFRGELEGQKINDAGTTDLTAGSESLWAGAVISAIYANEKVGPYGFKGTIEASHHTDVLNGQNATLGRASLDFYLDEKQKTSLRLSHSKGESFKTLKEIDETKISFTVKF